MLTIAITKQ